jgi:hypothetical protein
MEHLVCFMNIKCLFDICYILWSFGIYFLVLVYCTKKNLATLFLSVCCQGRYAKEELVCMLIVQLRTCTSLFDGTATRIATNKSELTENTEVQKR